MKIVNHLLVEDPIEKIFVKKTTNVGGPINLKYLVIHYTAVENGPSVVKQFLTPNKDKIAAHIVLDKDGTITQLVPFNLKANHAGASTWDGVNFLNSSSIGIEIINGGFTEKLKDGSYRRKPDIPGLPANTPMIEMDHKHRSKLGIVRPEFKYWLKYPDAQLEALYKLSKLLFDTYHLKTAVGHDDISPARKADPGPAFPWDTFKIKVFGKTDNNGKIFTVNKNNNATELRKSNAASAPVLQKLPDGFEVGLIDTDGQWSRVYLANKVSDVLTKDGDKPKAIKTIGWIFSSLLTLKAGQDSNF